MMRPSIAAIGSTAFFALIAMLGVPEAEAAERATRGGYPACETKEALEEAIAALKEDDQASVTSIAGCIITEADLGVVPLRTDLTISKVRLATPDGDSSVMWTENNNVKWITY